MYKDSTFLTIAVKPRKWKIILIKKKDIHNVSSCHFASSTFFFFFRYEYIIISSFNITCYMFWVICYGKTLNYLSVNRLFLVYITAILYLSIIFYSHIGIHTHA